MNLLDYIYNGEVKVFQEDLYRFLNVGKRFQLEGLPDEDADLFSLSQDGPWP